jgi:hypothetical protein
MSRTSNDARVNGRSNEKAVVAAAATVLLLIGGVLSVFALGMAALKVVIWFSGARRGIDEGLTW